MTNPTGKERRITPRVSIQLATSASAPAGTAIKPRVWATSTWTALLSLLTLLVFFIHGYHPFAEDGGIYAAGIYLKLDPSLFPGTSDFVRAPMRYSLFAPVVAAVSRLTQVPPAYLLLVAYLSSIWLMLFAARQILRRCFQNDMAQLGGLALLAAWWTLPVAGTSLLLMDPYVTARSLSTPLTMLALAYALDDWHSPRFGQRVRFSLSPLLLCILCLVFAALAHLLMALYALAFVIVLRIVRDQKRLPKLASLAAGIIVFCLALQRIAQPESPAYIAAVITRYYWFLSQWQWYEIAGLAGPIVVLALLLWHFSSRRNIRSETLCLCSIFIGLAAVTIALLFAHESAPTHLVARLQPLRVFLPAYAIMSILLGGAGTAFALEIANRHANRMLQATVRATPFVSTAVLALVMGYMQMQSFSSSRHIELPWLTEKNPWAQAFLWIESNTPHDALVAMDAHYIDSHHEDAQVFRAFAMRDALPDYSKDGGEASVAPSLAEQWHQGMQAQLNLNSEDDPARKSQLAPSGANWLVLRSSSSTALYCPYDNGIAKVCELQ